MWLSELLDLDRKLFRNSGSGSVRNKRNVVFRIRICMDPQLFWSAGSGSGYSRAKMTQKQNKVEKIPCFEVLDVLL
jgi:hypothetical protein